MSKVFTCKVCTHKSVVAFRTPDGVVFYNCSNCLTRYPEHSVERYFDEGPSVKTKSNDSYVSPTIRSAHFTRFGTYSSDKEIWDWWMSIQHY